MSDDGTTVRIKLRNNSPKGIVAVNIECGDSKNSFGHSESGIANNSTSIIYQPSEVFTMDMQLREDFRNKPIRINGVVYADGSEDGEKKAIESMQRFGKR